jgi:hypothetical protein
MGGYLLQNDHLGPRRVIKAGGVDQVDDTSLQLERLRNLHCLCARCKFVGYSEIRSADKIDELEYPDQPYALAHVSPSHLIFLTLLGPSD